MYGIILGIHVFIVLLLIAVILMQQREGGLSSAFGGGQTVFGGRGAAPFLTKTTIVLFIIFMVTSFTLTIVGNKRLKYETAVEKAIQKGELQPNTAPTGNPPALPENK